MAELRIVCSCPKHTCPQWGYCTACRAYHLRHERIKQPFCERKRSWWKRLFSRF